MIHTVVNEIMTVMMRIHWNMSEYFILCAFVGLNNKLYTMHSTYIKSVKFVLCVCVCVCLFVHVNSFSKCHGLVPTTTIIKQCSLSQTTLC